MAYFRGLKTPLVYLVALCLLLVANVARAGQCLPPGVTSWCNGYNCNYATADAAATAWGSTQGASDGTLGLSGWQTMPNGNKGYWYRWDKSGVTTMFFYVWPSPAYNNATDPAAAGARTHNGTAWVAGTACSPPITPPTDAECLARPNQFSPFQHLTGSLMCFQGCEFTVANPGNGGEVVMAPTGTGSGCEFDFGTCPTGYIKRADMNGISATGSLSAECVPINGDIDGDGLENGDDPSPDESGDQPPTDTDGDGTPDAKDFAPDDPNDGKELEAGETKATSEGGGNCDTPPSTKGDAVGAQVAYQTWATRCAVERLKDVTVSQGTSAGGLSAGDSQKLTDIKANGTATNSKLDTIAGNTGAAAVNAAAIATLLQGNGGTPGEGRGSDGQPASGTAAGHNEVTEYGAGGLDQSGMGLGNTCPVMPAIDVGGYQITPDTGMMCTFLTACGALVFLFGAIASLRVLGGNA